MTNYPFIVLLSIVGFSFVFASIFILFTIVIGKMMEVSGNA